MNPYQEPSETIIAFEQVTVKYGKKIGLDNFSIEIPEGSVYALLGRNGAGKSSAIRTLLGQWKPTSGRALLFGRDAWKYRAEVMARIGVVPEEPDAPPEMTANELAGFCSQLYPVWDSKGVTARLERFGIPTQTPFGRLSKGQKGNVMMALALGHMPDLLVLDDPTLGLDIVARKYFFEELIGELADRGTTVLITTHDLAGVEGIADRIGILKDGRLVTNQPTETLKAKFRRISYPNTTAQTLTKFNGELETLGIVSLKERGWGVEAVVSNYNHPSFERFRRVEPSIVPEISALSLEDIFTVIVEGTQGELR